MTTRFGIPTNLYRKGHPTLSPSGDPSTPLVLMTAVEAAANMLTGEERARLSGLPATFDAEPPPLTVCAFDDSFHELHCLGLARGKLEPIVHEHFTVYVVATQSADTQWIVTQFGPQTGAGAIATIISSAIDGHGVIHLASRGAVQSHLVFGKYPYAVAPLAGGALWVRMRAYFPSAYGIANMDFRIGLVAEYGSAHAAYFGYNPNAWGPNWLGITGNGSSFATVETPTPVATDTWYDLDIFFSDAGACTFFVNGDGGGATTITSKLPTASLTPYIDIGALTSTQVHVYVDLFFLDVVRGADIRHPLQDPALALVGVG